VLFKGLLGEAVEGERGDGAFKMRDGDAPGAVRATPASEVITFDPDQAFITHTSTFYMRALGFERGRGGAASSAKVNSCPPENILHRFSIQQSN